MTITIYKDILTGQEFATLPKIHNNKSPITASNYQLAGLEKITVELPDPEPVPVVKYYSKLSIMRALEQAGLWATVKTAITDAGRWDAFVLAQDLAGDDPDFIAMKAAIEAMLPLDAESLLQGCELGGI